MNDTSTPPPPGGPAPSSPPPPAGHTGTPPDRDRWRSLTDARRTTSDRVVAGVCAGVGRHLGIDPVIVRVVVAALTFAGLAGLILYGAAWLLLPTDDGRPSIASDWFKLGRNEPQVRTGGLMLAGVLAIMSIVGNTSWLWWGPWPAVSLRWWWIAVPVAVIYWLAVVLPRKGGGSHGPPPAAPEQMSTSSTVPPLVPPQAAPPSRRMRPPHLLLITVSTAIAALGSLSLAGQINGHPVHWSTYVATALMVVGAGLVLGAFRGRSYVLLPIGLLLCVVLAVGSVLPNLTVGEFTAAPASASQVKNNYSFGAGQLTLDLTGLDDLDGLAGRSVHIDGGLGQITVLVPQGLPVSVDARVSGGEIMVFGQTRSGRNAELRVSAGHGRAVIIDIDHTFGQIQVKRS